MAIRFGASENSRRRIIKKSCKCGNERLVSHSWCRKMMKAVGLNYFKKAKWQSVQWHRPMQDFVYTGKTSVHLSRNPQGREIRRYHHWNFFSISCVTIAVENLRHPRRRKNCDGSTYQSNNFGVSRKRFKPSTPGSKGHPRSLEITPFDRSHHNRCTSLCNTLS